MCISQFLPFFSFYQVLDSNAGESFSGFVIVHFSFVPLYPAKVNRHEGRCFLEIGTQNFRKSCHLLLHLIKKKVCGDL